MLDSEEAARRLGVKVSTVYAYVSRGFLTSQPAPDGRRSLFDEDEIERLSRRARASNSNARSGATEKSPITVLTQDGPIYRGVPALTLAAKQSFEEVADHLWATNADPGEPTIWEPFNVGPPPPGLSARDLLHWSIVMASSHDPLRSDTSREIVVRSARRLLATLVNTIPTTSPQEATIDSLAGQLASRLCGVEVTPEIVNAVNAALILYIDHNVETTLLVRVAASVRANVYDAALAGLCTLPGVVGVAAGLVRNMLRNAERRGVRRAIDEVLRNRPNLPGLGHVYYETRDPRAEFLLEMLREIGKERFEIIEEFIDTTSEYKLPYSIEFAIGAMMWATSMPSTSGQIYIFTIARTAGWIAHYLDELLEPPGRFERTALSLIQ